MKLLDFLLKYKDLIDLLFDWILLMFTFVLGFKGLDTINEYHKKKKVDLKYEHKLDLIKQNNHQLQEFISAISETQSLFKIFNNKYDNFVSEDSLDTNLYKILKDRLDQLESSYIKLDQVLFKSYQIDSELIKKGQEYRFSMSEYIHLYSKVFEYLEENNALPSGIDLTDEYFKDLTIFYDDTSDIIFGLFNQIEEITNDLAKDLFLRLTE